MAATITPTAAMPAAAGYVRNAPSSTRNSPTKPFVAGRPIDESDTMVSTAAKSGATRGNTGSAQRKQADVRIVSSTAARITEPAVGAATGASASQVWKGKIGTLVANARKKAPNSQNATVPSSPTLPIRWK